MLSTPRFLLTESESTIPNTVSIAQVLTRDALKHIQRIQTATIVWMSVEAVFSLRAAWTARSPVLAAFGGDSAVELLSAAVVLWRFRVHASEPAERRAARIAGGLLFALIAYVIFASAMSLLHYSEPKNKLLGDADTCGSSDHHARACNGKEAPVGPDRQCCDES